MTNLIRHIEYLISRKDCVIIPGFGAILANSVGARYDAAEGIFYPPSRSFAFNSDLTDNDGLLVCSVAHAQGISYEAAVMEVQKEVDAMHRIIKEYGELALGMAGTLTYDRDTGTMAFSACQASMLSTKTFWLPKIDNLQTARQTVVAAPPVVKKTSTMHKVMRKAGNMAASLLVLVGLYFLYCLIATPIVVEDSTLASLAPQIHAQASDKVPAPEAKAAPQSAPKYQVLVAQFATRTEAQDYITYNTPYRLTIQEADGNYCVSCGTFDTLADAETVIAFLAERFPGAWVMRN